MIEVQMDDVSIMVIDLDVADKECGWSSPSNPYLTQFGHISSGYNPNWRAFA